MSPPAKRDFVAQNSAQHKDACEQGLRLTAQFLTLAAAGIAFVVGLVFWTHPHINPWLVVVICAGFGLSIFAGLMVRMALLSNIRKANNYDIYTPSIKIWAVVQISLFLLGIAVLGGLTFRRAFLDRHGVENVPHWEKLASGITEGVSGLALVEHTPRQTVLLAVHDNKKPGEKRFSLIRRNGRQKIKWETLDWKGEALPSDLEAVCRIPGEDRSFLALTSKGLLYRLVLDQAQRTVTAALPTSLPNAGEKTEFEGFDMQRIKDQTVACWAERGDKTAPGEIFCSAVDMANLKFTPPQTIKVHAPGPAGEVRHVSDLRILSDGILLAASASDPGNDGPFAGAVYIAAKFQPGADSPQLTLTDKPIQLFFTSTHKIEAFELLPGSGGGLAIASDDENLGAAIFFNSGK